MLSFDNLAEKGRHFSQKAKDISEQSRLKGQIRQEHEKIKSLYETLGKIYYETDGENAGETYADMVVAVKLSLVKISDLEKQIQDLKQKYICPRCGAAVTANTQFCKQCGAKITTFQ